MTELIGLSGPAGVGKDKVAEYLSKYLDAETYSFATPLKLGCVAMFGQTLEQIEDRKFKESIDPFQGFSPRTAMRYLGTEFGRICLRDDLQLLAAEKKLKECTAKYLIITDVRFENERDWIDLHDGLIVHIQRPGVNQNPEHASEIGIEVQAEDYIMRNSSSLEELETKCRYLGDSLENGY